LALYAGVVIGLLIAAASVLSGIRETVMLSSPDVREAQARQTIAESNLRTAQLNRETSTTRAQGAAEASWEPWKVGAESVAVVGLLGAVPLALLASLVGAGLLFRRHMSLPTRDGRVPLIGLDRELSAEALFRYQALQGKGATVEALPVARREDPALRSYGARPERRLEVLDQEDEPGGGSTR
jgi:hypothetical protein